ncbi:hypothetical protein E1B28_010973 [Marasmius oreades]|uniref:Uncharacterized protein n=1 Tax=Marasmius oreades TaxID=181124 RepID=A0A9P7RT39_9AGAR|nr:uncharacterized protein E1B28_010973 [Marasmius oreades]KAG7089274.1 hypothetical protein E1B28_010973 [Marasmius oreades]
MGYFEEIMEKATAPVEESMNTTAQAAASGFHPYNPALFRTPGCNGTPMHLIHSFDCPLESTATFGDVLLGETSPSPFLPVSFPQCHKHIYELEDDTPRTAKRMKLCIEEASDASGLDKDEREPAEKFSKLHERQRDTVLFIKMQGIEKLLQNGGQPDLGSRYATLLLDTDFKTFLYSKIMACLLSPCDAQC